MPPDNPEKNLPSHLEEVREAARQALGEVAPSGLPLSKQETRDLMFSSATEGSGDLPPYYLVYFLLVDLLGFASMEGGKRAPWTVPVRYRGRLYGIEPRESDFGIFAPCQDQEAGIDAAPAEEAQKDSREIASLVCRAAAAARPWFEWRAGQAASGTDLNVVNSNQWLFSRYEFFRDRFHSLSAEAEQRKGELIRTKGAVKDGTPFTAHSYPSLQFQKEAEWNGQAAIEAFFAWTEHLFIHLSILRGKLYSGNDVAAMAGEDWEVKFRKALDEGDPETEKHLEFLLGLRTQTDKQVKHGAFGKEGEAFWFHSEAGPAPIYLTRDPTLPYSLSAEPPLDEATAILRIEEFIKYLWSGPRKAMQLYVFSNLPGFLNFASNGTYERAIQSEGTMKRLINSLMCQL